MPHAPIDRGMPGALVELLRGSPLSDGKVTFAWKAAVGPAIERVTHVKLEQRVLLVETRERAVVEGSDALVAGHPADVCSRCSAPTSSSASRSAVREAVIVSAVRTPTGKFLGALKGFTAPAARRAGRRRSRAPRRHRSRDRRRMHHGQRRRRPGSDRTRRGRPRSTAGCRTTSPRSRSTRCAAPG